MFTILLCQKLYFPQKYDAFFNLIIKLIDVLKIHITKIIIFILFAYYFLKMLMSFVFLWRAINDAGKCIYHQIEVLVKRQKV